jgi:hypothetical protein
MEGNDSSTTCTHKFWTSPLSSPLSSPDSSCARRKPIRNFCSPTSPRILAPFHCSTPLTETAHDSRLVYDQNLPTFPYKQDAHCIQFCLSDLVHITWSPSLIVHSSSSMPFPLSSSYPFTSRIPPPCNHSYLSPLWLLQPAQPMAMPSQRRSKQTSCRPLKNAMTTIPLLA